MSGDTQVTERIKSCRENLRISQVLLADLAGINPTQLYRYEAGKAKLRMEAAEKIAAALGVSTAWLVHGTLPIARGTQIDPPVPAGGGLILKFLELPPALAVVVKRLAMQNGSTVEMEVLDLVHQGLEAMHKKARDCARSAGKSEK
ncbi:XRE family transcriptional regulator [Janthinobacterium sp. BJB1]|uniref:helix-turn-helix domain-containing protein n=1 Tax=Janthinobacterium sp. GW458P TaxID=1981504 RepID=UPI000A3276B1|nr:helix-turn-helix transcriptional regulator [Janthinobacterium sp. GW458P]MBE3024314.1 helix-turn-helix transcriptional regulator [Janthinobacterium sp. GW458P]PHV13744.1 XRE family transcriptional regulator [Janthinobacterium sp. BJB303]PJC98219.1 XRE family transcriptional regulator [Janthinobacterium sp. BJB1]